ncbi:transposase [Candidatus Saccharibacteria bacterium]|nr:transposase [Candidatus Saccharibacteria bacterium]MCL1962941.1 transposase [Candidatus Saccharibacteria bacterium]
MTTAIYKQYKEYAPESYYHVYSRGVNKEPIFLNNKDYDVFISLFKRYLSEEPARDPERRTYPNYYKRIELLTYALMPNHFHLLIYQGEDDHALEQFMRSLMTSYSKYFNKEHKRVGPVFQSRYLAKRIVDEAHLYHISRYIHLNPRNWRNSTQTSLDFYSGKRHANWINPRKVLQLFPNFDAYLKFLEDYDPDEIEKVIDIEPDE